MRHLSATCVGIEVDVDVLALPIYENSDVVGVTLGVCVELDRRLKAEEERKALFMTSQPKFGRGHIFSQGRGDKPCRSCET
jgi:hypothetical protein